MGYLPPTTFAPPDSTPAPQPTQPANFASFAAKKLRNGDMAKAGFPGSTPDSHKRAAADVLANIAEGKPPVSPRLSSGVAGTPPVPSTDASHAVATAADPTKDPNSQYYGASPESMAQYSHATSQRDAAQQQLQATQNAPDAVAPTYTAPVEDHVGRRNTAAIVSIALAALLGPGRNGAGNFLANLAGGMGQGRQQLMQQKTQQAKDQFTGEEDQYKVAQQQQERKLAGATSLYEASDRSVQSAQSRIDSETSKAQAARQRAQDEHDKQTEFAKTNNLNSLRVHAAISNARSTQARDDQRLALDKQNSANTQSFRAKTQAMAQARLLIEKRNSDISAARLSLEGSRAAAMQTPQERTRTRLETQQNEADSRELGKMPAQLKDQLATAHKVTFAGATDQNDPARLAAYNSKAAAIYANYRHLMAPIFTKLRSRGVDTSSLETDFDASAEGDVSAYGGNLPAYDDDGGGEQHADSLPSHLNQSANQPQQRAAYQQPAPAAYSQTAAPARSHETPSPQQTAPHVMSSASGSYNPHPGAQVLTRGNGSTTYQDANGRVFTQADHAAPPSHPFVAGKPAARQNAAPRMQPTQQRNQQPQGEPASDGIPSINGQRPTLKNSVGGVPVYSVDGSTWFYANGSKAG